MAVTLDTPERKGLVSRDEYIEQQRDKNKPKDSEPDAELTEEEQERFKIIACCAAKFDEAKKAREPFENFDVAWNLFVGNTFPTGWPAYRAKITINVIRAIITFIQAIMTDSKPRLYVEPRIEGSEEAADLLRKLVDRDWDDNEMQDKLSQFVQYGLIWGTAFMKMTYDPYGDGGVETLSPDRAVSHLYQPHRDLHRGCRIHHPGRAENDGLGAPQLPR